jgi:hypothetical protein
MDGKQWASRGRRSGYNNSLAHADVLCLCAGRMQHRLCVQGREAPGRGCIVDGVQDVLRDALHMAAASFKMRHHLHAGVVCKYSKDRGR